MTMRAQLIIDCGSRVLSALIVTADGRLVPCSHEIRQTAMRHLPSEVAFERRVTERADFLWDEALEVLAKAQPHQFFARARRIGLHRPWESGLAADAVRLASPLTVLSSPTALADPAVAQVLPAAAGALLDALLDPIFAFVAVRKLAPSELDAVVVVPAHAGSRAHAELRTLFRRRGFRRVAVISREIAAAMALVETPATECLVGDVSERGLHLHRVVLDADGSERRLTTIASATLRAWSWNEWLQRIAAALRDDAARRQLAAPVPAALDRALTAFLTGAPHDAFSHASLQRVLDDSWRERCFGELVPHLREALAAVGGSGPAIVIGELCGLDAIRRLLLDAAGVAECAPASDVPVLDRVVRGVAAATLWLRGDPARRLVLRAGGGLRINTLRSEAVEIVSNAQLPQPGEHCHVRTKLAFRGAVDSASPFLVHLLWGADRVPEGNATLCALRFDRGAGGDGALRLAVHLRRSRGGRRLNGTVSVAGSARAHFTHEFPLFLPAQDVRRSS